MKTNKKFHWSEETLNHFEFQSSYDSRAKVLQDITLFVENDCTLENNETEDELINDLINQIYN
jgi:hypothetical protein